MLNLTKKPYKDMTEEELISFVLLTADTEEELIACAELERRHYLTLGGVGREITP